MNIKQIKHKIFKFCAIVIVAIFLFAVGGCSQTDHKFNIDSVIPVVHASGGIEDLAYLNSQEGFNLFLEKGYKYFEVDFIYTSDNVLVCSHKFDYIDNYDFSNRPSFEEFKNLHIAGKYHTMTMSWLAEQLQQHKDVKIIFDTKEKDKTQVLIDAYKRFQLLGLDTQKQFIGQIYWADAYMQVKDLLLNEIWFTNYKAEYTQQQLNSLFDNNADITTYILSEENFLNFAQQKIILHKKIGVHYGEKVFDQSILQKNGVDYLFVNFWTELGDKNNQ